MWPLLWLLAKTPFAVRRVFGRLIGLLWFDILRVRRRIAIANIRRAFPKMTEAEAIHMARQSLIHMGHNIVDVMTFPYLDKETILARTELLGAEHLDKALSQGRGGFFLTAHLGNGDFATAGLAHRGYPMTLISKIFKSRWLNDFWFHVRESHGVQIIPPKKSTAQILRALKENRFVIFVLDQYTGHPNGIVTEFFGHKTGTAFGLALLAKRTGAPVVPIFTYRNLDHTHTIEVGPEIPLVDHEDSQEFLRLNTQIYCDYIERMIRRRPEQWMWVHRRWKNYWVKDPETGQDRLIRRQDG